MVSRIVLPSSRSERTVSQARSARLRVEAGGGLVEEDQLGVADERQREVQAPQLPARELAAAHVGLLLQPREREHLLDVARMRVEARPVRAAPRAG